MSARVTDWLSGDLKPVRVGVYQKIFCGDIVYAHWNGDFWGMFTGPKSKPEDALRDAHCRSMAQRAHWRGLAEDPSGVRAALPAQGHDKGEV